MATENPLNTLNVGDSLDGIVENITVGEATGKQSGKKYRFINLTLCNGEELHYLVNFADYWPLKDAVSRFNA